MLFSQDGPETPGHAIWNSHAVTHSLIPGVSLGCGAQAPPVAQGCPTAGLAIALYLSSAQQPGPWRNLTSAGVRHAPWECFLQLPSKPHEGVRA